MTLERNDEFPYSEFSRRLGCVHTNRVESSPIQSIPTHKGAEVTLWLNYNCRRGSAYTPAGSSQTTVIGRGFNQGTYKRRK